MIQPKIDHYERVQPDRIQEVIVDGVPVLAFTVKDGDVHEWDKANVGPGGKPNERAEISFAAAARDDKVKSPYNVHEGMRQTYRVKNRFKAGWPMDQRWATLLQFHLPDTYKGAASDGFHGISVHGPELTLVNPFDPNGGYFFRTPLKTDTWFGDWWLIVNWSSKGDGYIKLADPATKKILARHDGRNIPATGPDAWGMYLKQGYYRDGGVSQEGTVYQTIVDITDGDLTKGAAPVPEPVPVTPPAPASVVDPKKAQAGLQALVDTRLQLEAVTLPMLDAEISELQKRRAELGASRDRIAAALDVGDWGGGVVAK